MGVIAGWFSCQASALSFRARRWIGQRGWRLLHYTSFAAFGLALMHALYAGTDFVGVKGSIIAVVALAPVLWLGFLRILEPTASRPRGRTAGPTARSAALQSGVAAGAALSQPESSLGPATPEERVRGPKTGRLAGGSLHECATVPGEAAADAPTLGDPAALALAGDDRRERPGRRPFGHSRERGLNAIRLRR